ncbi:hypothetical protein Tco_1241049 [Tanacetum coccineum]
MTDVPLPNVQATQGTEDTYVILTAPINPEDVPVTTIVEPPLLSATTLPPPPNPLITHLQQTSRLRDEAQAENADFINKLDDNIKKIFKDQVKEQTSLAIAANLSKLELKKILIDKMESNKEDEDKDEEHSAGSNQGSKRRRAGKEPESTSAPKEKTSKTTGKSTEGSKSHHKSAGESTQEEEPMHTAKDLEEPVHQEFETGVIEDQPNEETSQHPDWFQKPAKLPNPDRDWNKTLPDAHGPVQPWLSSLTQMENPRDSFDKLMDTTLDFSAFVMNRLKVDTLTPELLTSPTFELMKGTCKSLITIRRDDDKLYKFKEGDFNRLHIQDIEDMLLLLVQDKLKNLIVEERLAFNVSLRMFTRSIVIQRRVEDLQLGVESYQKKLNLTKPDKKNRLMCIDELHKFSDGTLDDVRNALNDRLKGIRMQYLLQTIWR